MMNNRDFDKMQEEMLAPQYLKIVDDCVRLVNNTKNPDVYFSRYDLLIEKLTLLSEMRFVKFSGDSPKRSLQKVLDIKERNCNDFIIRYYESLKTDILTAKRSDTRMRKATEFYAKMYGYYNYISMENRIECERLSAELRKLAQDKQQQGNVRLSKCVSIFTKKWRDICATEFVVLDFETTGLDKSADRIIEIAAIRFVNGVEKEKFVSLVNPECRIPAEATAVNNITNIMVLSAPKEKEIIPKLIEFLGDSLLVGHNVNFDVGFLENAAKRSGMQVGYNYIDTLSVSRKMFAGLENYKLGTVASAIGMNTRSLHRAEADVRVCAEIIDIALNTLAPENMTEIKKGPVKHVTDEDLSSVTCPKCGIENPKGSNFCYKCATDLRKPKLCSNCGTVLDNGVCPNCETKTKSKNYFNRFINKIKGNKK